MEAGTNKRFSDLLLQAEKKQQKVQEAIVQEQNTLEHQKAHLQREKDKLRTKCEEYNMLERKICATEEGTHLAKSRSKVIEEANKDLVVQIEQVRTRNDYLLMKLGREEQRVAQAKQQLDQHRRIQEALYEEKQQFAKISSAEQRITDLQQQKEKLMAEVGASEGNLESIQNDCDVLSQRLLKQQELSKQSVEETDKLKLEVHILKKRNAALLLRLQKQLDRVKMSQGLANN